VIATTYDSVGTTAVNVELAASILFAASGEHYTSLVHGRAKIENPPGTINRLNRRNFTGTKVAQKGDYDPARQLGHLPILLLHEVSGALHPESYRFLRQMAEMHDNKLPYDLHGQSWTVQSFTTYFLQRFSSAVITWLSRRRSAAGSTPAAACPRLHPEAGAASGFGLLRARDARRAAARPPLA
jgi:hypothetical protein